MEAVELVLTFAPIGILGTWGMIMTCALLFRRRAEEGRAVRPAYRLPRTRRSPPCCSSSRCCS